MSGFSRSGVPGRQPQSASSQSAFRSGNQPSMHQSPLPPPPPPPPLPTSQGVASPFLYGYNYSQSSAPPYVSTQPYLPSGVNTGLQGSESKPIEQTHEARESEWTCDACEISLDSEAALRSHRRSHVKCSNCSFEGAPKIVKAHYEATHGRFSGSGFKTVTVSVPGCRVQRFKICVGNRPEDIQKWKAERKKKFPRQKKPIQEAPPSPASKEDSGMMSLLAGYGSSSGSDDEGSKPTEKQAETTAPPANAQAVETAVPSKPNPSPRLCRYFMRNGSCLNGDACRFSHETPIRSHDNPRKRKRGHATSDALLTKLLSNDMEREFALTMQLLDYVASKDFFGAKGDGSGLS